DRGNEVIEIQKIWKLVGFTPRKFNNEIYLRFRAACDAFFNKKRDFYTAAKDEQRINMNRKMELIEQAEALSVSTEWKKTTDIYVNIQKQWKEIGPVPRKFSDAIWERFRAACNKFFNLKKEHFSGLDNAHAENLRLKKEIIEKLRNFDSSGDNHEDIEILKTLQNEWSEIGHVPFHDKDAIQTEYRELIGNQFQRLRLDVNARQEHKFKNRIDNLKQSPKGNSKIKFEREKLVRKLQKIEKDIITWENNIGFFANSKNANDLIKDIEQKIVDAKEYAVQVREKLDLLEDGE
ncbi:MAG: hypothetical protein RIS47_372, partial [Bacteroidota bacterium]